MIPTIVQETLQAPMVKPTPVPMPLSSLVTLQADPPIQVALDQVLPAELLQQIDFNKHPGLLAVRDNGVMEYILCGANGKVVYILLLQPDGTICFKRMSPQVDFKQPPLVSSNFKKTVPPHLAALGVTLESRLQLLSVKDGVGVYGIYNAAQEMVCCVRRNSNSVYEFETDVNHLQHQQHSPSSPLTTPSTQPSRNCRYHPPVQSPKCGQSPARPSNRCIWCDSFHHLLASCPHLLNAVQTGQVSLDKDNHVVNAITGQEFIPMLGHGGMMAQM
jgi:hypothetical protein